MALYSCNRWYNCLTISGWDPDRSCVSLGSSAMLNSRRCLLVGLVSLGMLWILEDKPGDGTQRLSPVLVEGKKSGKHRGCSLNCFTTPSTDRINYRFTESSINHSSWYLFCIVLVVKRGSNHDVAKKWNKMYVWCNDPIVNQVGDQKYWYRAERGNHCKPSFLQIIVFMEIHGWWNLSIDWHKYVTHSNKTRNKSHGTIWRYR